MKFLNFKLMVSPFLLKVVYIIGALSITIGSFVIMFGGGAFGASKGGTVPGLGILIFGNLFYRIIIELMIVMFSIHEGIVAIQKNASNGS